MKIKILVLVLFILGSLHSIAKADMDSLQRGEILPKVVCSSDPEQSYALYLPSEYSKEKKWPVLFLFEPGARAMIPMNLFKDGAEKYKYILVCSNNSRNGPAEPVTRAIKAIWKDSRERLSIDFNRIYAGGFSGGARVCSWFKYIIKNQIAGIIAFGAGLSPNIKPEQILPADYFAAVGMADFNYKELVALNESLYKADVFHRVLFFEGIHRWGSKEICTRALEWMEIRAFKKGLKKTNDDLIKAIFEKELNIAREFSLDDKVFQANNTYTASEELFEGLVDVSIVKSERAKLLKSQKFKKFQKNEKKRLRKEMSILKQFNKVYSLIRKLDTSDPYLKKQINRLPVKRLLKQEKSDINIYSRSLAIRLLTILRMDSKFFAYQHKKKGDLSRSIIFLELGIKAGSSNPHTFYDIAKLYALIGKKKKAIKNLERAIKAGFKDSVDIKNNRDFKSIRNEKKFHAVILKLETKVID